MHSGECSASHDCIDMPTGNLYHIKNLTMEVAEEEQLLL